jgi:hypothetical protein
MDILQLVLTSAPVLGIALVAAMAVLPLLLEVSAGRAEPSPTARARTSAARRRRSPRRRSGCRPADLPA